MRGRQRESRSPYSRVTTPASTSTSSPDDEIPSVNNNNNNNNRLLGLISPASKMITGAAKMISTVFFPDSPASETSEDDSDDDDDDISSQGDDISDQKGPGSEVKEDSQLNVQKNDVKLAIEHLLSKVTFTRDECDKLVKIIESRVVEFPAPNISDRCNSAIMEARKWVEEKKTESYSKFDKDQVTEEELGSPVLMAKSYMKSRPPWASPTASLIGFKSTSPTEMYPSKEDTHALSSSKDLKRSSLAIDMGNTLDGSKRVRFRAAEDTAHPLSPHDNSQTFDGASIEAEIGNVEMGEMIHHADSMPNTEPVKQSAIGDHDQDFEDAQTNLEGGLTDSSAVITNSKLTEGIKSGPQSISNGPPQVNGTNEHSSQPRGMHVMEPDSFDDPFSQEDQENPKEMNGVGNSLSSASSLSGRENTEAFTRPSKDQEKDMIKSRDVNPEGSCELLSEASVEIPDNDEEISNIPSGSRNSTSRFSKEVTQVESPSISSPNTRKRTSARIEKLAAKKAGYTRRGRSRGK